MKIFQTGCGNSSLSVDMFDVGYTNMTNIDISEVVINQMKKTYRDRDDCKWIHMDATSMSFDNESYSVVLDKGTLDAMMSEESDALNEMIQKYFSEVTRVLKPMGRFVIVSLLQEHIIKSLIEFFPSHNFLLRVVRCNEAEQKTSSNNEDGSSMPVFLVVATKFSKLPSKIFEISHDGEKIERLKDEDELTNTILTIQRAAMVRNGLIRKSNFEDEINFDLFRPNEKNPRFSLYILDQKSTAKAGKYAAFIVPQGSETDWLYATKPGRRKVLQLSQHSRLAIVTMHRGQSYSSLDDIKLELNDSVKSFSPKGMKPSDKIPFLSVGADVGTRKVVYKGTSELSGDFVIEDVTVDEKKTYRRLIFLSNQSVIQSEALLMRVRNKTVVDFRALTCDHHIFMIAGILSIKASSRLNNLIIGLGGGGLLNYIHRYLKEESMTAIEIDPAIVQVAKEYFGLIDDQTRLEVVIADGLKYLKDKSSSEKQQFQSILFDIDSKDQSLGMSCPPKEFLEKEVLTSILTLLPKHGIFILNFVCRDETIRDQTKETLKEFFPSVFSYKLDEDVNEIFYCMKEKLSPVDFEQRFKKSALQLNGIKKDLVDVEDVLSQIKLN